jgi:hypothetical protein
VDDEELDCDGVVTDGIDYELIILFDISLTCGLDDETIKGLTVLGF